MSECAKRVKIYFKVKVTVGQSLGNVAKKGVDFTKDAVKEAGVDDPFKGVWNLFEKIGTVGSVILITLVSLIVLVIFWKIIRYIWLLGNKNKTE